MKTGFTVAALLLIWSSVGAQEYKLAKSSGTLDIKEVNHVTIEGYDGNEIIFSASNDDHDSDRDRRSKGLRAVSANGLEDNSGVGLSVIDKGATIEVRQLKKMDGPDVRIKVPKGISVSYEHTSPYGGDLVIRNVAGAIDVSTVHNKVVLENNSGEVDAKTVHGEINAVFGDNIAKKIVIESEHGPVDVTLPATVKADIKLKTHFGEVLVDPVFKIEAETTGGLVKYNDQVTGKINGGGIDLRLSSNHNNVYLRKK